MCTEDPIDLISKAVDLAKDILLEIGNIQQVGTIQINNAYYRYICAKKI